MLELRSRSLLREYGVRFKPFEFDWQLIEEDLDWSTTCGYLVKRRGAILLTSRALDIRSATMLLAASLPIVFFPAIASASISFDPGLSRFSRTKNTSEMMAKNSEKRVNQ